MRCVKREGRRCDDGRQGIVHNFRSYLLPGKARGPAIRIDDRSQSVRASAPSAPADATGLRDQHEFLKLKGIRASRQPMSAGRRYWRNKA